MDRKNKYLIIGFFASLALSLSASYWTFVVQNNFLVTYGDGQELVEGSSTALCETFESPTWFLFSPSIPTVVYYTHFIPVFFSLLIVIFILFQKKHNLAQYTLLSIMGAFIIWLVADFSQWITGLAGVNMLIWNTSILTEVIVFAGSLYLIYLLIDKKDTLSFNKKLLLFGILLPIIILSPTTFNLSGIDLSTCYAVEGFIALYYSYAVQIVILLWILIFATARYQLAPTAESKQEILYLSAGVLFLLVAFASNNIIGSATGIWDGYGLFGMPVFAGILFYSIVRFKTFGIRILASVALVVTLMIILFLNIFI